MIGCSGSLDEGPLEHQFSFVVIADPHIVTEGDRYDRLSAAVDWINGEASTQRIEIVVVVGDIGWGGGLPLAKNLLDGLAMPYLPILGDNEVHIGAEETFDQVFAPQIQALANEMDSFRRGNVAVIHPVFQKQSWIQNYRFSYRGIQFVGLDWVSRNEANVLSELADLNDFEGGSFPFFQEELTTLDEGRIEDVVLFSHHPMHFGSFNTDQLEQITGVTGPLFDRVAGSWAGHYHINHEDSAPDGSYEVFVTDATWDDENTVRLVEVWGNDARFEYRQRLVELAPL